jgi:hypothetical protein
MNFLLWGSWLQIIDAWFGMFKQGPLTPGTEASEAVNASTLDNSGGVFKCADVVFISRSEICPATRPLRLALDGKLHPAGVPG